MNSRGKTTKILLMLPFLAIFLLVVTISGLLWSGKSRRKEPLLSQTTSRLQQTGERDKLISKYSETSPDGIKEIILYERPFTGKGDVDYRNYLVNQFLIVVREIDSSSERDIFINDYRTGNPSWLGNDYVFFTSRCGTGCRGLYLVNVSSRVSHLAVITTTPLEGDRFETDFRDWFGQKFRFPGLVEHFRSVTLDDKVYLVFRIKNINESVKEKKFLFNGEALIAL